MMGGEDKLSYTDTVQAFNDLLIGVRSDIKNIDRALHGNGQKGILERLTRLEEREGTAKDRERQTMRMIDANAEAISDLKNVSHDLKEAAKLLAESPSLLAIIRRSPFRAAAVAFVAAVTMLTVWLGLYIFVRLPGVEAWLAQIVGVPLAP